MNFKWAIGTVVAVLGAIFVLPGVANAHHNEIGGSIECQDGTWEMHVDYSGGNGDRVIIVAFESDSYDIDVADLSSNDAGSPANQSGIDKDWGEDDDTGPNAEFGVNTTLNSSVELDDFTTDDDFNFSPARDRFEIDGHGGPADATDGLNSFIAVDGTYQNIDDRPDDQVQLESWMYDANNDDVLDNGINSNGDFDNDGDTRSDLSDYDFYQITTTDFWAECGLEICLDGETGVEVLSFQNSDTEDCDPARICVDGDFVGGTEFEVNHLSGTNDCGPVRICVDGESMTVTRFEAEQLDGQKGSCVPTENPPPPPPETPEEPAEPVEEEAVAEVSPVVEEVAALPAAGFGTAGNADFEWTMVLGLVLIGVGGGATVLIARRS